MRFLVLFLVCLVCLSGVSSASIPSGTVNITDTFTSNYSDYAMFLQAVQEEESNYITMQNGLLHINTSASRLFVKSYDVFNFSVNNNELKFKLNGSSDRWVFLSKNSSLITSPYSIANAEYIRFGVFGTTYYVQSSSGGTLYSGSVSGREYHKMNVSGNITKFYLSSDGITYDLITSQNDISPSLDNTLIYFEMSGGGDLYVSNFTMSAKYQNDIEITNHMHDKHWSITPTYDDGGKGDLIAEMLSKKYNIVGTSYVPVNFSKGVSSEIYTYLNDTEMIDMYNSKSFDIGAHTYDHVQLLTYNGNITHQLNDSSDYLTNLLNVSYVGFAYPYGGVNYTTNIAQLFNYGRTTVGNSTYPWPTSKLSTIAASSGSMNGNENARYNAYKNGWQFKPFDHSGGLNVSTSQVNTISERGDWETTESTYNTFKTIYSRTNTISTFKEIVEYQELYKNASINNKNYTTGVLSFDFNSSESGGYTRYTTPLTVRINLNNAIDITVDENINITIDGVRTRVYIENITEKRLWIEVPKGNHTVEVKNGSTPFLYNGTLTISNVSSTSSTITFDTDNPSDSIIYYTDNTSAHITNFKEWSILSRNTTKNTNHNISIPSTDYLGGDVPSSFNFIVASTNENRVSAWDDNGGAYYTQASEATIETFVVPATAFSTIVFVVTAGAFRLGSWINRRRRRRGR